MSAVPVPTVPIQANISERQKVLINQIGTDRSERSDPLADGGSKKNALEALAERLRAKAEGGQLDHDEGEAAAMRQFYSARAGPDLPPDTYAAGLLRGFHNHRQPPKDLP